MVELEFLSAEAIMIFYDINEEDMELKKVALSKLESNYDGE